MAQCNSVNAKLSNLQLNKMKSTTKIATEVTLKPSSNMIGDSNDDTNFPHKILLTAKGPSAFFINSKPVLSKRPRSLSRNSPNCIILHFESDGWKPG